MASNRTRLRLTPRWAEASHSGVLRLTEVVGTETDEPTNVWVGGALLQCARGLLRAGHRRPSRRPRNMIDSERRLADAAPDSEKSGPESQPLATLLLRLRKGKLANLLTSHSGCANARRCQRASQSPSREVPKPLSRNPRRAPCLRTQPPSPRLEFAVDCTIQTASPPSSAPKSRAF